MTLKVVMSEVRSMVESHMRVFFIRHIWIGGWVGNEVGGVLVYLGALVYLF